MVNENQRILFYELERLRAELKLEKAKQKC